jgi:hypothetical protein
VKRPVCPLDEALCGHPDAGGCWEHHCDNHLEDCGFDPVAPEDRAWRSCYFSPMSKCCMIAHVDDFKIAGPQAGVAEAWRLIHGINPRAGERGIILDVPTPAGKFLRCNRECSCGWAPPMRADSGSVQPLEGVRHPDNGTGVHYAAIIPEAEANAQGDPVSGVFDPTAGNVCYKQIKYDMADFLGSCVRLRQELASTRGIPLKPAFAPFIDETGDGYGLGARVCAEAPDDPMFKDAYRSSPRTPVLAWSEPAILLMDITLRTLQIAMRRCMETLPVGGRHIVRTIRRVRFPWNLFAPVVRGISALEL